MQKPSKRLWQIVPHPIQTKVARGWLGRENTTAYLREKYDSTWRSWLGLQSAANPGASPHPDLELDLARVYAAATQCVIFDTYKEFNAALNQIAVWQLADVLVGDPPWLPQDLYRAKLLILPPTDTVERTA